MRPLSKHKFFHEGKEYEMIILLLWVISEGTCVAIVFESTFQIRKIKHRFDEEMMVEIWSIARSRKDTWKVGMVCPKSS